VDYTAILREAWLLTWRNRFLWVLGLFAGGGGAGTCGNTGGGFRTPANGGTLDRSGAQADMERAIEDFGGWLGDHIGIVIAIVAAVGVVALLFTVISLIAQGGLYRGAADIARGRPSGLGAAWGMGLRLFWRNVRLALLTLVIYLPFLLIVIGVIAYAVLAEPGLGAIISMFALVGLLVLVLSIPIAIVLVYAHLVIAVEEAGAVPALTAGVGLVRQRLGTSLMLWLINVAVSIGAGIAFVLALVVAAVAFFIIGLIIYAITGGAGVALLVYIVMAAVAAFAAIWLALAIFRTFSIAYWTLAYLRLTGQPTVAL
jgi:hypothetical protein